MLENTTNRKEWALFKRSSSCSALVYCGPRECGPSIASYFLLNLTLRYLWGLRNSSAGWTWSTTTNLASLCSQVYWVIWGFPIICRLFAILLLLPWKHLNPESHAVTMNQTRSLQEVDQLDCFWNWLIWTESLRNCLLLLTL